MTQSGTRANNHGNQLWYLIVIPLPGTTSELHAEGTSLRNNRQHLKKSNENSPDVTTTTIDDSFTIDNSASAVNNQVPSVVNVQPPPTRAVPSNEKRTRSERVVQPPARYPDN